MSSSAFYRGIFALILLVGVSFSVVAHPLRLSLTEIEVDTENKRMTVSLRLFLMDVREALLFDPENEELAFCKPNESAKAEPLLIDYLSRFFFVKVNGKPIDLKIKSKRMQGEGINTALAVTFEFRQAQPLTSLEIKNAVFTDLFFDQNNIVYVHIDGDSDSFMLSKKTPTHYLAI